MQGQQPFNPFNPFSTQQTTQQPFNPFNPFSTQQTTQQPQTNWQTGQVTQPSSGGGLSGTGLGSMIAQAISGGSPEMRGGSGFGPQNPFSYQPAQQTSMFGGQMQGGGYGQYGANNPFSPYSNSFLNLNQNLNRGTEADKVNAYRSAIQGGFGDQQIRNQAEGLFGRQSQQDWNYLQGQAFPAQQRQQQSPFQGMTSRPPMQPPIQNPFSYQQPSYGPSPLPNYVSQTISNLDQYRAQPVQAYQSPFRSSGPSQAIVGRSSQMRGTPNVMRRADGGITSLMDDE
jgi:hypothetical protein